MCQILGDKPSSRLALNRIAASIARDVSGFICAVVAPGILAAAFSALRMTLSSSNVLESKFVGPTKLAAASTRALENTPVQRQMIEHVFCECAEFLQADLGLWLVIGVVPRYNRGSRATSSAG
jgi:hypothetical protein